MVRLFFVLFLGISMFCGGVDAARSRGSTRGGSRGAEASEGVRGAKRSAEGRGKQSKLDARRGRSVPSTSGRRARVSGGMKVGARSAFVGSVSVNNSTLTADSDDVDDLEDEDDNEDEDYAPIDDNKLKEIVKGVKNEVNAVEQCVMTLCDAGTDSDATTMALCSNDYKKKKLSEREEELREREDAVRRTLSAIPRQKLTKAEKKLYDSIKMPEKKEKEEDDSLDFDSLMGQIEDMSDSLDSVGTQRRETGESLLEKAVGICAKKFPDVISNTDDFVALMTVRADNSAAALAEYYDKKAYKLGVALDKAKNKLQMAAVNAHRDLEDTDSCVESILDEAETLYGANFAKLAKCDDLTDGCADKNFAQLQKSKAAFATTLDGCKDGDAAWDVALMQVQRVLAQSAKSEIFESKSGAVEALAEAQEMCLSEMSSCIEDICGGSEAGNIFCYSGNDPFKGKTKNAGLSLYKEKNTAKVNSIFRKMNEKYGIELKQVSLKDAKGSCAHRFEKCNNRLALLAEDPALSAKMVETELDADRLFKQAFANIQIKADRDFVKHEGELLETQLAAIKSRLATRVELAQAELKEEKEEMKAKTKLAKAKLRFDTEALNVDLDRQKAEMAHATGVESAKVDSAAERAKLAIKAKKDDLKKARLLEKATLEDAAMRQENVRDLTNRKLTAETDLLKKTLDTKAKKKRLNQKGKIDAVQAERDAFYKLFCDQYNGAYNQKNRVCSFGVHARRNKRHSWDFEISVSPIQGTKLVCKKGNHGISKKPKGCTFKNGQGVKGNKGMFSKGKGCSIPSLDQMFQMAKEGKPIGGTCFGTLDLGQALGSTIQKTVETEE